MQPREGTVQVLRFDNVRPPSLTLDALLGGRVIVQVIGTAEDVPTVLLALPVVEHPPAA